MRRLMLTASLALMAAPFHAAGKDVPFFSLKNTDFIVLISFIIFLGILAYFKIPDLLTGMLDKRAPGPAHHGWSRRACRAYLSAGPGS